MITQEQNKLLDTYNAGLALYKERKFSEAKANFQEGLGIIADDGPSQLYIDRCNEYIKNPPDDDWDGVFVMTTK